MKANRWIFLYPLSSKHRKAVTPPFPGTPEKRNLKISLLLLEVDGKGVSREISVLFSNRTERSKELFMFIFTVQHINVHEFQIGRKEPRNYLVLFSDRTERKNEFFVFLFLSNTEICIHDRRFFAVLCRTARLVRGLVIS